MERIMKLYSMSYLVTEAAFHICFTKQMFLRFFQISHENIRLMKLHELRTFYRAPRTTASVVRFSKTNIEQVWQLYGVNPLSAQCKPFKRTILQNGQPHSEFFTILRVFYHFVRLALKWLIIVNLKHFC